jgi:hypothetical protein
MSQLLAEALDLLKTYSPQRYNRVRRSIRGVLIFGRNDEHGSYHKKWRICELNETFVANPETTATAVASTLVHEATHGWLFDLGIPYDERLRHRIELICIKAAMFSVSKLPDSEPEVERCRQQLTIEPQHFSDASFLERDIGRLRELGCPQWVIRSLLWARRRRAA